MPREQTGQPAAGPAEVAPMGDDNGSKSGVTAEDVVDTRHIRDVQPQPSKAVQRTKVGDKYIDEGPVCLDKGLETPGCLFGNDQRTRVISDIVTRIGDASKNYQLALAELRVEALLQKSPSLHWVLALAIDLANVHVVKAVARAALVLKSSNELFRSVDEKSLSSAVKSGFDPLKKAALSSTASAMSGTSQSSKARIAFIDQLKNGCDEGFRAFGSYVAGYADDAQLHVVWEGFAAEHHTVGAYKQALSDKLARFETSGVTEIRRQVAKDRASGAMDVVRDTRVIWVEQADGTKVLHYQNHEHFDDPNFISLEDLGVRAHKSSFGDRAPRTEAKLAGRVPSEFQEIALARSEATWGPTPTIARMRNIFVPSKPVPHDPGTASRNPQPATRADKPGPPRPAVEPDWDTLPDSFKKVPVR